MLAWLVDLLLLVVAIGAVIVLVLFPEEEWAMLGAYGVIVVVSLLVIVFRLKSTQTRVYTFVSVCILVGIGLMINRLPISTASLSPSPAPKGSKGLLSIIPAALAVIAIPAFVLSDKKVEGSPPPPAQAQSPPIPPPPPPAQAQSPSIPPPPPPPAQAQSEQRIRKIKDLIADLDFDCRRQNDAHEFLTQILDDPRFKELKERFKFTESTLTNCQNIDDRPQTTGDPSFGLQIEIPDDGQALRVSERIVFNQRERQVAPRLDRCPDGDLEHRAQTTYQNFSDFVLIHLKIFRFLPDQAEPMKITNVPVDIEHELQLGGQQYDLIGLVKHNGQSIDRGHYIANVKRGDKWWSADDGQITVLSSGPNGVQPDDDVYMLLYHKREGETPALLPEASPEPLQNLGASCYANAVIQLLETTGNFAL